jgi:hypothetical protein
MFFFFSLYFQILTILTRLYLPGTPNRLLKLLDNYLVTEECRLSKLLAQLIGPKSGTQKSRFYV